jgi:manganese/iron transport system permease protein/iron/zinc/copper transport system permease protein
MSYLTEPFEYDFFFRALIVTVLIGALAGAIGPFVLVRRMAYIGQGMSQSILGGVAVAVSFGIDLYLGAAVAAALSAALIYYVRNRGLPVDTAIGIVASALFAVGVAVVSSSRDRRLNTANLLFGNVLGVQTEDIIIVMVVSLAAGFFLFHNYKSLLAATHNYSVAAAHGVKSRLMEVMFNALLATVVVTALRVLGVLLVAATLLIPAATAATTFRSFGKIALWSSILGVACSAIGLFISFHRNIASGPAIVLVGASIFIVNLLSSPGVSGKAKASVGR